MAFMQRKLKPRPYAVNSTGRSRGTLNLGTGFGRVQVSEAIGPARAVFRDKLGPAIITYLNDNSDKQQDSASFVDLSLFMMGKLPDRTKPMVMFVSDDKQARKEAFRMIKHSGIMEEYPGFGLGEMELKAEFENLRPLGSQSETVATVDPESASFFAPEELVEVFAAKTGSFGAPRLEVFTQNGWTINTSSAVAGGVITYKGSYFWHTADHILQAPQTVQDVGIGGQSLASHEGEDEYEVMGWSNDEDEDDELLDITSRGSASPIINDSGSTSDSLLESEAQEGSVFSHGSFKDQDVHMYALQSRLEMLRVSEQPLPESPPRSGVPVKVGQVVLRSTLLDSAFVQIHHGGDVPQLQNPAIPLESYQEHIEAALSDAAIKTTTPNGTIGGTLSGTPSFVRLPGSKIFQKVYVAMLNQPLVPGDCGSWVKNAVTGKLFGHVIAGSPTTGLILLIPAARVFADALAAFEVREVRSQGAISTAEETSGPLTLRNAPDKIAFSWSADLDRHNTPPALPRSAPYLTKHRRTPSAPTTAPRHTSEPSAGATSEDIHGIITSPSVRQSLPPMMGGRGMPNGAIIWTPDPSSDDDDLPEVRVQGHGRPVEVIKELQDAIGQIPLRKSSSPSKDNGAEKLVSDMGDRLVLQSRTSTISEGMHHSLSTGSLDDLPSGIACRFSHARLAIKPNFLIAKSSETSLTGSEEDSDEDIQRKPQMIWKKSGELVRSALRPSSRRRPSSMPGTPTFSKAVQFDSHLEHVRHFLQVDRPLAVSAGSSPVENYESDTEYPFNGDDGSAPRSPPFEWEIVVNNFPVDSPDRTAQPVRLERVWLSTDQKCLIGSVVVANLAFQKYVACRFTFDYWKTMSEVTAEYMSEMRPVERPVNRERFNFTIKLSDLANLESKTLYFCIRYNISGQEYWDNNGGMNFQADFRKKSLPQNGKKGVIGAASRPANGLPKSNRRANPPTSQRPKSMPIFDQSIHDYLGESAPGIIRLKGVKSSSSLPTDNLPNRLSTPSGQAFANRYDFGASLTAAIQNAKDQLSDKPDGLYMKPSRKAASSSFNASKSAANNAVTGAQNSTSAPSRPNTVAGNNSPGISSSSYEELVNKYCFVCISR